ncbi:MAG: YigZ family protein [Bacilli bacterium]|nr:YigZ family protein [Bacilli bacterium]
MLSVKNNYSEFVIKKSKFISYLFRVNCVDDISRYLNELRVKYKDATHICYAYILDNIKKCSDDGEPSKTAGMPILNVLESNNLNHVICIVIRYFGGVKLGANGLVRAYGNCCKEVIFNNIVSIELGNKMLLKFNYDKTKIIDNLLKNALINDKSYDDTVSYKFTISNNEFDKVHDELVKNILVLEKLENCYIEKNQR